MVREAGGEGFGFSGRAPCSRQIWFVDSLNRGRKEGMDNYISVPCSWSGFGFRLAYFKGGIL